MVFVNEYISEEDIEKYGISEFNFPVQITGDGHKTTLWKWVVDHERDAFLVHTYNHGGGYEGTPIEKHYVLSLRSNLVSIEASPRHTKKTEEGLVMTWDIHLVKIPNVLWGNKDEVIDTIKEAYGVLGQCYNGEEFDVVLVNIEKVSIGEF